MAIVPRQMICPASKKQIKYPYPMNPTRIVVHNTYNDASADAEVRYMNSNNNLVSFHFAVDNKEVVQGIPLNCNAWHAGDGGSGAGNRQGIAIEICYSKSGGARFVAAEKLAARFIAQLLKERGWGVERVTKHQDYSGKYCPHRTLDMGWERFLNMIKSELSALGVATSTQSKPTTTSKKSVTEVAKEVVAGKWGNGEERKKKLTAAGYDYNAVQKQVNALLSGKSSKKSITEIAKEVIVGKWGNGADRKKKLTAAGYDYNAVQAKVNQLLR